MRAALGKPRTDLGASAIPFKLT